MITIDVLAPEHAAQYTRLLLGDERSLIFSTLEFRDFLRQAAGGLPHYLVARDQSGIVVGGLPLFRKEVPGLGAVINSLPWYGSHGGVSVSPGVSGNVRDALLARYMTLVGDANVLAATLISSPFEEGEKHAYGKALAPTTLDHRIGQMTELPDAGGSIGASLEALLTQKTRNLARKSRKQGFALSQDDSDSAWELLNTVHAENMLAIGGKAKPREHFDALRRNLPETWRRLTIASLDGEPVAALLLLYFNKTVEYFTPVIRQQYRSLQPLSFLIWHGLLDAVERGFRWWNWGGTWASQRSLHHFKAGWGARDHPYTYFIHASERGMAAMRADREAIATAFPYYYVFPFDQLDNR